MTYKIKQFIEENIEAIEQEDWHLVFLSYYLHYHTDNDTQDKSNLIELLNILEKVFPDIHDEAYDINREIIIDAMSDEIYKRVNQNVDLVTCSSILKSLKSKLGFSENVLHLFFVEAANSCGFHITVPEDTIVVY